MEMRMEESIAMRKAHILYFLTRTVVNHTLVLSDSEELSSPKNSIHLFYINISCANMIIQLKKSMDEVLILEDAECSYRICPCKAEENWQFYLEFRFPKLVGEDVCYVYFAERRKNAGIENVELTLLINDLTFQIDLKCFLPEQKLVENFIYFIKYQDFATEMERLDINYQILKARSISGRKAEEYFEKELQFEEIKLTKKMLKEFRSLKKSPHLRKKWRFYWKRKEQPEPELNEVIDTIHTFFDQIAQALEKDEILVADWMPQLNRFL